MAEVVEGGLIKQYIITLRAESEVSGTQPIATTATEAVETQTSKVASNDKTSPKKKGNGAKQNIEAHTVAYRAATVVMPYFNAKTNGQASVVFRRGYELFGIGRALAMGATSMAFRAAAGFAASLVTEAITELVAEQARYDKMAQSIDETNRLRASVGLSTVSYKRQGIKQKVVITSDR